MSEADRAIPVPGGIQVHWRTVTLVVMALVSAAVLVGIIWTLGSANRQRDRALDLQSHSYEVMILARALSGTIANAEASLGRYVVSGDRQMGQLYATQWEQAGREIDRLDEVTDDNTTQQDRIDRLRAAFRKRGNELARTARATDAQSYTRAFASFYAGRNADSLIAINTQLDRIIDSERALLARRADVATATVARSNRIAAALAVFGIFLVMGMIALGWATLAALAERAAARAEAEAERERASELEIAIDDATAELRAQEAKVRQIQKMEAVGQLTGGIAHDFNNMLAVVLGGLELAQRQIATDPQQAARHIDNATEGAHRAAALTKRLLVFSREHALRPEALTAAEVIAGMADLLDRTLGDAIKLQLHHDDSDWHVWTDRHQLENAVLNLAVNARDAMEGRGRLTIMTGHAALPDHAVGTCAAGDYVTIAVSDTGCGMSPDVLDRAFEPFFTTKPAGKGTGLGLSQIFGFVRQSGGEIGIVSQPGDGTVVTLYLPRHLRQPAAAPEPIALAPPPPVTDEQRKLLILVVEDDPRVLGATCEALSELGHDPVACDDPLKAPALLEQSGGVDLIISDVQMPGQTGPEMIAGLDARYARTPVLFVTGFAGEARGDALGGHGVLRKPFTLVALERAVLAASAQQPTPRVDPHPIAAE